MPTMSDEPGGGRPVAAVDCGTNSTRLLIARVDDGTVHPVSRHTTITRLGAGVDATGSLTDAGITRVVAVLEGYARRWRDAGVTRVAVSATSAVRDSVNAGTFVAAVRRATGTPPVVLDGAQEAALTFLGATVGLAGHRVVCDIGGGSTELICGAGAVGHWVSLQLGSVRLRERHLHHDPPTAAEYAALCADVESTLDVVSDAFRPQDGRPLLAVAGTALTTAAVARRSTEADADLVDGTVLTADELAQVIEDLAWLPAAARLTYPPIVPGREDVIVAGALLLAGVAARFGFAAVQARVADLLDGVALRAAVGAWPSARVGST